MRTKLQLKGYFDTTKKCIIVSVNEFSDKSRFVKMNDEQWAFYSNHHKATYDEIWQAQESVPPTPTEEQILEMRRQEKIHEIMNYDTSDNVNGFYLNGELKWLDKETRTTLANTIESLKMVGRNTLTIWFGDTYIEIGLDLAKQLLAVLEVYATDCYNVTASHINAVNALQTIEEIESFDISFGYPARPDFNTNPSQTEA